MESMGERMRRAIFFLQRRRMQRELDEEMSFHLEEQIERNRAEGMSEGEARAAALRRFGNPTLLRERSWESWGWSSLDHLWQDLRFALHALAKTPCFALAVVLTLGIGIGANTAVFSAVYALLLNPYPFPHSERIVDLMAVHRGGDNQAAGYLDYLDWRQQATSFDAMAIAPWVHAYTLTGQGDPQRLLGGATNAEFWHVLAVEPVLGRFFTADEEQAGTAPVAVLTYDAWVHRFARDPAVLGRTLALDGRSVTIIGVLPNGFRFPGIASCEIFTPLRPDTSLGRTQHQYDVVARLKPDASVAQAQSEMDMIARRLEKTYPETSAGWRVRVETLRSALAEDARGPALLLSAIVACVLLLAAVNVSGLMLARATSRTREMAIRAALGAGRLRLVRQMLTESMLLSVTGGAVGCAVALGLMRVLRKAAPEEFALDANLHLNLPVLGFTLTIAVLAGLLAGLLPAWRAASTDPQSSLKEEGTSVSGSRRHQRQIGWLVAGEVALSVALLASAGMLTKSFLRAVHIDTGMEVERVLSFGIDLPRARFAANAQVAGFGRTLVERLRATPGIEQAATVVTLPLDGSMAGGDFVVEGRVAPREWGDAMVRYNAVSDGYFRTMGIPLERGRDFGVQDTGTSQPVAIVNDTLARRYFPGESAVGHRYQDSYDKKWRRIVGVVGAVKNSQLAKPAEPEVFAPQSQWASRGMSVVMRGRGDEAQLLAAARGVVRAIDANLLVENPRPMREVVANSLGAARLLMKLLLGFGLFALVLDAVGIYGIVDDAVRQRRHEVGIRMALGASRAQVLALMLCAGIVPALTGAVVGIPVALAATRLLGSVMNGARAQDPWLLFAVAALLVLVALGASLLPAWRAAKQDAILSLRAG